MKKFLIIPLIISSFFISGNISYSASTGDLTSPNFMIDPSDIYPGVEVKNNASSEEIANWLLGVIIQNMMVALGAISILIMTIGAGFMILHNGSEELLNRGKTIFMAGIYAMIIALASYYLIAVLSFLLYS